MIYIENDNIKVIINPFGAELEELIFDNIDILWKRNLQSWNSQSPILFPIVGRLKDSFFIFNDQQYTLNTHGFVRKSMFEVEDIGTNYVILSNQYSDETLSMYPFKYKLIVKYEVINKSLIINFKVINIDKKDIYFSLGYHPGFKYSELKRLLGDNLIVEFDKSDVDEISFSPYFVNNISNRKLNNTSLSDLREELFIKDTLCINKIKKVLIKGNKNLIIENEMNYFAFWQNNSNKNPEFICIEEWDGLPDCEDSKHQIEDKLGIIKLGINEIYDKKIKIRIEG